MSNSEKILVAVGVIKHHTGKILLSRRAQHQHQGDQWEFPGGKVEPGESLFEALVREFLEEVNLTIQQADPLMVIEHDYGDKSVILHVWISTQFTGDAVGNEGQEIRWVLPENLRQYTFPKANQAIIDTITAGYES